MPRRIRGDSLRTVGTEQLNACAEALHDLVARGGTAAAAADGPWSWALRSSTLTTPQQSEEMLSSLEQLADVELPALQRATEATAIITGTPGAGRISDWAPLPGVVEQAAGVRERLTEEVWQTDVAALLDQLRRGTRGGVGALATRITSGPFRAARKEAMELCGTPVSKLGELVGWLEEAQPVPRCLAEPAHRSRSAAWIGGGGARSR